MPIRFRPGAHPRSCARSGPLSESRSRVRPGIAAGLRAALVLLAVTAAGSAHAHPGHGADGLAAGLAHPLAADHLLTMLAVGTWSALSLRGARAAAGPAAFIVAMLAGAALGTGVPGLATGGAAVDALIAAGLAAFGALLAFAPRVPATAGVGLVLAAGLLHGFAHGTELPAGASLAGYAAGFVVTSLALQGAGLALGHRLRAAQALAARLAGAGVGAVGLLMLAGRF